MVKRTSTAVITIITFLLTTAVCSAQMSAAEHFNLGMTLGQAGKYELAEEHFTAALELSPQQSAYITALATAQFFQGQLSDAAENYRRALSLNDSDMLASLNLGIIYSRLGQYEEAVEQFKALAELDTISSLPYHYLAIAYGQLGEHEQEMSAFEQALHREPENPELIMDYGLTLATTEDYEGALNAFEHVVAVDPLNIEARRLLQDVAGKLGVELELELPTGEELAEAEKYFQQGLELVAEKKFSEAAKAFELAVKNDPQNSSALVAWGAALTNAGDLSRGREVLEQTVLKSPGDQLAWYNLGINLGLAGWLDEAVGALTNCLDINEDFAPAHRQLGRIYSAQMVPLLAEEAYQTAISQDPAYLEARMDFAIFLIAGERFDDAQEQIEYSAELNPDDPYLLLIRGLLASKQDKPKEAEKWLRKSFQLDETNPQPLICLGLIQLKQGKSKDAEKSFTTALEVDENDAEVWADLGEALFAQGKYDQARRSFNKAISNNPILFRAYLGLGLVSWALEDLAGAVEDFQWALAVGFYTETGSRSVISNLPEMLLEAKRAILKMQESATTPQEEGILNGMIEQLEELEAGL